MALAFTKMHGLGNDFVVLDATRAPIALDEASARHIADRRFGIGCDQILIVEPPRSAEADFAYRILNADGSESGQCGNGARCFVRYVREAGLTDKRRIVVDIRDGQMTLEALDDDTFAVALGVPQFAPARIPLLGFEQAATYRLDDVAGQSVTFSAVSLGNPHAVIRVPDVATAEVEGIGPALERHPAFPERVNVGFCEIVARDHVRLRVFERGAGETLACGSGAAAAVVTGIAAGDLDADVRVDLPGGTARIHWESADAPAVLIGPAERVFEGKLVSSDQG
ncbi:diaminopimelate epimerase [Salinisphaera hydrothermalis]|uniref:Diaminopimelate epimerase n=1 Tax=Salinisphaera hydrothermalis (strain C41B8) TaxID=1304275 RepID=A0A084IHU9_SALHC|nr:diaminopimelate epimerase [Salinisphaera hydrothermalis]KEZ76283.1 diaminopimelate epimerase [Salinisphaera hydrothermalis C41B8]